MGKIVPNLAVVAEIPFHRERMANVDGRRAASWNGRHTGMNQGEQPAHLLELVHHVADHVGNLHHRQKEGQ